VGHAGRMREGVLAAALVAIDRSAVRLAHRQGFAIELDFDAVARVGAVDTVDAAAGIRRRRTRRRRGLRRGSSRRLGCRALPGLGGGARLLLGRQPALFLVAGTLLRREALRFGAACIGLFLRQARGFDARLRLLLRTLLGLEPALLGLLLALLR